MRILFVLIFGFSLQYLAAQEFDSWTDYIKEDFDEEQLVINNKKVEVSFFLNKKTGKPEAIVNYEYNFVSLKANNFSEKFVVFFDDQSEISTIKVDGKKLSSWKTSQFDYNGQGIFHSDTKVSTFGMYFNKQGDTKKVEYSKLVKDIKYIGQYYFHDSYGVYNMSLTINIPDWLNIGVEELNFEGNDVAKQIGNDKDWKSINNYSAKRIDPWHTEYSAEGPTYIYPHILLLPQSYTYDNKKNKLFETVDDLYGWYSTLVADVGNENDDLKPIVAKLTEGLTDDKAKIEAIYYWVQDNIRYIAFEDGIAGFKPESCQNVFKHKYGDCKGMANLNAEMLKIAGYDARLTWLGTRRIAYDYSFPSLTTDNHMICSVILGDEVLYLDPTEKYTALGENATRIQDQEVLIQDGDKYLLKKIPTRDFKLNKIQYDFKLSMNENQQLLGNARYVAKGECKTDFFNIINNLEADELDTDLKKYLGDFDKNNIVTNLVFNNKNDRNKPLDVAYDISIDNAVTEFGSELYIQLDPYKDYAFDKIDKDRKFDYLRDNRRVESSNILLEIPTGYKIKYLPESLEIDNNEFHFSVKFKQDGNQVTYEKKIKFPSIKISKSNFEKWNIAIKALKDIYNDQIVLEKK